MIYFDNSATTKLYDEILSSYTDLLAKSFANSNSHHCDGIFAAKLLNKARKQIADICKIKEDEIIFTSGATESNNTAIKGIAFNYQNRGKHLITSTIEHPSVLETFAQLRDLFGFEVDYVDVGLDGKVDQEQLRKLIRKDTILVSIMMVNNEVGTVNEIENIYDMIKSINPLCYLHVDATQGFGKLPINFDKLDLLSMSAHKIHGLKGSGLLYKKESVNIVPLMCGGSQEFGLRSGTSNYIVDAMLAKAVRLSYEEMDGAYKHLSSLKKHLIEGLKDNPNIEFNCLNDFPYIVSIYFKKYNANIVASYLDKKGIEVSSKSACSSKEDISKVIYTIFKDKNRAASSIRVSFSNYNTIEEVDELIKAINDLYEELV